MGGLQAGGVYKWGAGFAPAHNAPATTPPEALKRVMEIMATAPGCSPGGVLGWIPRTVAASEGSRAMTTLLLTPGPKVLILNSPDCTGIGE